ncbi:hypothetical protein RclHR1_00030070 [Rhizophagus clarus]|uniref:Uncharacterized protein n=1 Tax=Rhizophagus clarus TaxID=94130 RepID=A0A2Z6R5M7_9GLOM|nr:hypothetical protein RclHR1_00030070 [Rhizophagus clarus]
MQENDSEAGPGPVTQAHRDEQRNSRILFSDLILNQAIIPWKPPSRINIKQFKTIFSRHGKCFIINEKAEKWDRENYDSDEARLPILAEIEQKEEKNRQEYIEKLLLAKRQEYEAEKEYATSKHF